jgi:hypothetical protein
MLSFYGLNTQRVAEFEKESAAGTGHEDMLGQKSFFILSLLLCIAIYLKILYVQRGSTDMRICKILGTQIKA